MDSRNATYTSPTMSTGQDVADLRNPLSDNKMESQIQSIFKPKAATAIGKNETVNLVVTDKEIAEYLQDKSDSSQAFMKVSKNSYLNQAIENLKVINQFENLYIKLQSKYARAAIEGMHEAKNPAVDWAILGGMAGVGVSISQASTSQAVGLMMSRIYTQLVGVRYSTLTLKERLNLMGADVLKSTATYAAGGALLGGVAGGAYGFIKGYTHGLFKPLLTDLKPEQIIMFNQLKEQAIKRVEELQNLENDSAKDFMKNLLS